MFLGRYWFHVANWPFHVFVKILIPYSRFSKMVSSFCWKLLIPSSRFSRITRRIFGICRPHRFHKLQQNDFHDIGIPKHNRIIWNGLGFSWVFESTLVPPKSNIICLGIMVTSVGSENHENEGLPAQNESSKLLVPNEAEYWYGVFGPFFS